MIDAKQLLAYKLNGPVFASLLNAQYACYAEADEWLAYRNTVSAETANTEDLDALGVIVGAPRPYVFIDDEIVYASDEVYRRFILNIASLKRLKSISALSTMLNQFVSSGLYDIAIQQNGDIRIVVDEAYDAYLPFLQQAVSSIYTAAPKVQPFESRDFRRFIFDNGLYYYYIMLRDPGTWTWVYDEETETVTATANKPGRIVLNKDPEDPTHVLPNLSVISEV